MESLKIIGLCIIVAMLYGIAHDQLTARICVEYFTIGHPRVIASESPTLLALVWGVLATWWVGLILGIPLAIAARRGPHGRVAADQLLRPLAILLAIMAALALIAGVVGYLLAARGGVQLIGPLASRVPADRQTLFIADAWAHSASYLAGFVGGIVLIVSIIRRRRTTQKLALNQSSPDQTGAPA